MSSLSVELSSPAPPPSPRDRGAFARLAPLAPLARLALPPPPLEPVLASLDGLRGRVLAAVAPRARSLVVDRDRRVALAGATMTFAALVATNAFPMWFLALGPLVWGVPHLVADLRYLVTRQGYHRRPLVLVPMLGGIVAAAMGLGVRGGVAGAAGALLFARASIARRLAGVVALAALFGVCQRVGVMADLVYAHAHNAIAVALWWAWRRRGSRLHWVTLAVFLGGSALIVAGSLGPLAAAAGGFAPVGDLTARELARGLSPWPFGAMALRMLALYAFGQSVHYIVWLRLLPEDDRPSSTPRGFRQSYRALRADVGSLVLWIAALLAIAFAVWAAIDVGRARNGYLQMAFFHGYLELAAAAVLWAEAASGGGALRDPRAHAAPPVA